MSWLNCLNAPIRTAMDDTVFETFLDFCGIMDCVNLLLADKSFTQCSVKPVLSSHSKIDKTMILLTIGSLMKGESIAECSPYF